MKQEKNYSLIQALINNNLEEARQLIKKEKSLINQQNDFGVCPLHVAASKGWYDIVQLLLQNGADPNLQNELYDDTFDVAAIQNFNSFPVLSDSISNSVDENEINFNSLIETNNLITDEIIQALKEASHRTALHIASNYGFYEIAHLLLEHGAFVDIKDLGGCTPLHWAAVHGNVRLMKLLLDRGANVNQTDLAGSTPLHEAVRHKKIEASQFLLEKGADPELSDIFESSAMELARSFPPILSLVLHYSSSIPHYISRH